MNYEQLEVDVVERLQPFMPSGVTVVSLPESDEDMQGKPFINGRITVVYSGSDYGDVGNNPMRSTGQIAQNEVVMFDLFIQSRRLRTGDDSLFKLVALCKKKLIGYMPTSCDRVHMKQQRMQFEEQDKSDLFSIAMSFETTTLIVEEYDSTAGDMGIANSIQFDGL